MVPWKEFEVMIFDDKSKLSTSAPNELGKNVKTNIYYTIMIYLVFSLSSLINCFF